MTMHSDSEMNGIRVLVTGATGYVAGHLVERLLQAGAVVNATVRDPSDTAKIAHLAKMAEGAPGSIAFFRANLLEEGSFDEAMAGCNIVFHTASPFFIDPDSFPDPQRDLVDPALKGTINVLESVNRTESVTRVVVTSSTVTMYSGFNDPPQLRGTIDEANWNDGVSVDFLPYMYSKVLAEKKAWEMAGAQDRWKMVTINPGFVLGPGTAPTQTSGSFERVRDMADGTYKDGIPPQHIGMVDVRDVSEAHFRAGFYPEAEGRYIISEAGYSLSDLVEMLRPKYGADYPFPDYEELPEEIPQFDWDNRKSIRDLGLTYRPITPGLEEMFEQIVKAEHLERG